jgi:hypothetical protein
VIRRCPAAVLTVAAAFLGLALPGAAAAYDPHLTRYPYLTDVVGAAAMVNWATDRSATTGRIRFGEAGVESCSARAVDAVRSSITVNGVGEYAWRANLSGLTPGARYCYRAELGTGSSAVDLLGSDASPAFFAQLPAGSSEPFSFAVLGDWGAAGESQAGADNRQADLMSQIAASGVRFAVGTGDTAYPGGTQTNYGDLRQSAPNVSGVFGPQAWARVGSSLPLFNAIGNHGFNRTFLSIWPQDAAVAGSGGRWAMEGSRPSAWYAFDAGRARYYVLEAAWGSTADEYKSDYDAHWTPGSDQYRWLENDLRAHASQLKFAFFHFPLYSSNATEGSDPYLRGPNSLEGLLARYGVSLAFSGHAHNYTRTVAPPLGGLATYVTGGGGARLQPATRCAAPVAYAVGWSYSSGGSACGGAPGPTATSQVFHFLKVTVDGTRVTVAPTDSQGRTFDVQTYDFSSVRPPPPPPPTTPIAFVRQTTAATQAPASSFAVPIASSSGDALVAAIAVQAGTTTSVSSVTDSAGNAWSRAALGFLPGSSTRVELWYSTGAAATAGLNVTLSAPDLASANVSEWSGVAASGALEAAGGQGNAASTSASTPAITTANADDLVVGAFNFPRAVTSTLATPGFSSLNDFTVSTVRGRAAHRIASAAGSYSAGWSLSGSSPSGAAIAAFKAAH